jgi:hypothetical protein
MSDSADRQVSSVGRGPWIEKHFPVLPRYVDLHSVVEFTGYGGYVKSTVFCSRC